MTGPRTRHDVAAPTAAGPIPPSGARPGEFAAGVRLTRGTFTLDMSLAAAPGEVVALLGPNGAGKSTFIGIVAGLLAPDSGTVTLGGRTLTDDALVVPAERRRIGLMGQDPLLFPHLTALENIAFGPRAQGTAKPAARAIARDWLERLGLAAFADRKPAHLSGGQRQRVALGRALAANPELLLLDEPLGALDAQTAPEVRHLLRDCTRAAGLTTLIVTHDVLDAAMLADSVVVLAGGRVVDSGPTAAVLTAPRTTFTAALAGLNLVTGTARGATAAGEVAALTLGAGPAQGGAPAPGVGSASGSAPITVSGIAADPLAAGGAATAVFPPSAVAVYRDAPGSGSPRNSWAATIVGLEPGPSAIRVRARLGPRPAGAIGPTEVTAADGGRDVMPDSAVIVADLTPAAVAELELAVGSVVHLAVKATEVHVHAQ